jgi:hypothetical protein
MYRVTATCHNGHAFSRLVYADSERAAVLIVLRGRPRSCFFDIRAYNQVLQISEIAARVMAHVDSTKRLQEI